MKRHLAIPFFAAALLLAIAAAPSRADLTHAWHSASEPAATLGAAPTDSIGKTAKSSPPSLDAQIADLLDDDFLSTPAASSPDLSTVTISLSEEERLLDRLAVKAAAEDESEAATTSISAPIGSTDPFATGTDRIATRVSSAMGVQGLSSPDDSPSFSASDKAANYGGEWNIGDDRGSGFDGWRNVGSADLPSRSVNDQGFAIYAQSGVGVEAIGRSFDGGIALESGSFKVSATHDSVDHFSGFALYSDGDAEILRWGVTKAEDPNGVFYSGFWYAIGAGGQVTYNLIAPIDGDDPITADYSISWSLLPGGTGMDIYLSIGSTSYSGEDPIHLTLGNSSAVTAIAALVAGSAQSDTLHFDSLSVEGHAVPEPSTLALLLLGVLACRSFCRFR